MTWLLRQNEIRPARQCCCPVTEMVNIDQVKIERQPNDVFDNVIIFVLKHGTALVIYFRSLICHSLELYAHNNPLECTTVLG